MRQSPTHKEIHDKTPAYRARHQRCTTTWKFRWPDLAAVKAAARGKVVLAGSVLACLAFATVANGSLANASDGAVAVAAADRTQADRASRSYDRTAALDAANRVLAPELAKAKEEADRKAAEAQAAAQAAAAQAAAQAAAADEAARKAAAERAWIPVPIAGLTQGQMNNVKRIVEAGEALGLPKRAYVIAVATAMQESGLYDLASPVWPESFNVFHEGSGADHDSVGLFQQRPTSGWGTVLQCMDPTYAAQAFYRVLVSVPGWDTMPLTYAAQRVQVSAFPQAYAKHEGLAQQAVNALVP